MVGMVDTKQLEGEVISVCPGSYGPQLCNSVSILIRKVYLEIGHFSAYCHD